MITKSLLLNHQEQKKVYVEVIIKKLLSKIKEKFTDFEQQLFLSSFYCYLNCDPINDFVIDLDNVWQWLGFSSKFNAKRLLENNFTINNNYKLLLLQSAKQSNQTKGGHNKETFMLNIETFTPFNISNADFYIVKII